MRILVVEDELLIALDLKKLLSTRGVNDVDMAPSAKEAQGLVERRKPDLVFLDIRIKGGRNGLELGRWIAERFPRIVLAYITAYGDEASRKDAESTGCIAFINKPLKASLLDDVLERASRIINERAIAELALESRTAKSQEAALG